MAADLIHRKVAVIATSGGTAPALAAKSATVTIPIVFVTGADPVRQGLVDSLNRPGGNLTGASSLSSEVAPKRLELLHEIIPQATKFAVVVNPGNPNTKILVQDIQAAAHKLGVKLEVLSASNANEIDQTFENVTRLGANGLVVGVDGFFISRSRQLGTLALRHAVPTVFQFRQFAAAGGLMSYGNDFTETYRQAGIYTGRVLRGEKPADLPVQQVTKIELIINLKTAKALGLTIPITLLGRADEVIE
jgi:putative ABC transport system substrate-binding protein